MPLTATDDEIKSLCVRSNFYCVHENSFSSCVSAPSAKRETFIISPTQQKFEPRVKPESTLVKSFWNVRSSQRNSIQKPFYDVIMCGGRELRAMQMRTKIQFVLEKIKNFPSSHSSVKRQFPVMAARWEQTKIALQVFTFMNMTGRNKAKRENERGVVYQRHLPSISHTPLWDRIEHNSMSNISICLFNFHLFFWWCWNLFISVDARSFPDKNSINCLFDCRLCWLLVVLRIYLFILWRRFRYNHKW